jgi:hypothetical protein
MRRVLVVVAFEGGAVPLTGKHLSRLFIAATDVQREVELRCEHLRDHIDLAQLNELEMSHVQFECALPEVACVVR